MKYLLLLNNDARDVESWQAMSEEESRNAREQEMPRWNELFGWIAEQGIEVNGQELDDPKASRVVRVRDGKTVVTDGPIELAQHVPLVSKGSVEIRPLVT
jgi:hypothetical protein